MNEQSVEREALERYVAQAKIIDNRHLTVKREVVEALLSQVEQLTRELEDEQEAYDLAQKDALAQRQRAEQAEQREQRLVEALRELLRTSAITRNLTLATQGEWEAALKEARAALRESGAGAPKETDG
jgi:hypothetical protein